MRSNHYSYCSYFFISNFQAQTSYLDNEAVFERNGTNFSIQIFTRSVGTASGTNILGIKLNQPIKGKITKMQVKQFL